MADTVANVESSPAVAGSSPAGKKAKSASAASKKPRVKANHPPTAEMVNAAIKSLKERGGSSLQAIKKYLTSNYKIDAEKLAPFIKKYLKGAVTNGQLIQTKGKGASGSFKLAASKTATKSKAAPSTAAKKVKATAASGEKKAKAAKKPAASGAKPKKVVKKSDAKKPSADKKKAVAKKSAVAKSAKSPKQKPTKATKSAVKKPKTPKPKKVTQLKKSGAAAKKPVAPKKK